MINFNISFGWVCVIIVVGICLYLCLYSCKVPMSSEDSLEEKFSIAKRTTLNFDRMNEPPSSDGKYIEPHIKVMISGYVYKDHEFYNGTPKLYFEGKKIEPIQYFFDFHNMTYYFMVSKSCGLKEDLKGLVVETNEDVKPLINGKIPKMKGRGVSVPNKLINLVIPTFSWSL